MYLCTAMCLLGYFLILYPGSGSLRLCFSDCIGFVSRYPAKMAFGFAFLDLVCEIYTSFGHVHITE